MSGSRRIWHNFTKPWCVFSYCSWSITCDIHIQMNKLSSSKYIVWGYEMASFKSTINIDVNELIENKKETSIFLVVFA